MPALAAILLLAASIQFGFADIGHSPEPATNSVFPDSISVGETFVVSYALEWTPDDVISLSESNYNISAYPYLFKLYLPDKFSIATPGFDSVNMLAARHHSHALKEHEILLDVNLLGPNPGSVEVRLDRPLMFDEDYALFGFGDSHDRYFILRQDEGAAFVKEGEGGMGLIDFDALIRDVYPILPHPELDYVASPLRPTANSTGQDPGTISTGDWEEFAAYVRYVQSWRNVEHIRLWLQDQGHADAFVGAFLDMYPEFRQAPDPVQVYLPKHEWPDLVVQTRQLQIMHGPYDVPEWLQEQGLSQEFAGDFLGLYPIFR